jgi:hypothetical protein
MSVFEIAIIDPETAIGQKQRANLHGCGAIPKQQTTGISSKSLYNHKTADLVPSSIFHTLVNKKYT